MHNLDNVKLSTRDREKYTGHENLWFLQYPTVKNMACISAANLRSKKSSMAPRL